MGKKILIVDDATTVRDMVSLALSDSNYETFQAGDGQQALDQLTKDSVDLIICDVNMPVMDGIDFLDALKNDDTYSSYKFTPVIMLTTESSQDKKKQGIDLGAKAWLVKPFKPEELIDAVSKFIP